MSKQVRAQDVRAQDCKHASMFEWISSGKGMIRYSIVQRPFQVVVVTAGPPPLPEISR